MISKYKYKGLLWVDLESPRREEIQSILEEFNLPENLEDKMYKASSDSSTDINSGFTYSVLYLPKIVKEINKVVDQEVDFIIGKNFLITVHYEFIDVLDSFAKKFEAEELLEENIKLDNSATLFYYMIQIFNDQTKKELKNFKFHKVSKNSNLIWILCIIITVLGVLNFIQYFK